ncbi:MAG: D-aminoacylase [Kordiimonadaceae bacterium]|nr:D-aminoacylase [Kordiimonadaceae bacterium]
MEIMRILPILASATALLLGACSDAPQKSEKPEPTAHYDTIIRGGTVYDGLGGKPYIADVAIDDDRIAKIGDLSAAGADTIVDATGKAVSPGFVNMLSWAVTSLLHDGRGLSDVTQGVTLEVFGEGNSWGPLSAKGRKLLSEEKFRDTTYDPKWNTLGEYLEHLEAKGVSPNVASFIGATTVRVNQIGSIDREPTAEELEKMKAEVRVAMEEGAMGLGSSLIYAPAFYSKTDELVELAKVVGEYDGMYISHMRSEGPRFLEALEELITIAKEGNLAAEVYHLKASGKENWHKMDKAIARIEEARAEGLAITADMYTYLAGSTGLDAAMPPWVQEGGVEEWIKRLQDPEIRARVKKEMQTPTDEWENLMMAAGPKGVLFASFENPELRHLVGKRLSDVAAERGQDPEDVVIDLVIADGSRVGTTYFLMSTENMHKQAKLPWLSFGSDSEALDPVIDKPFGHPHPRAYGTFARVLGSFVRDERLMPMEEAIRKLSHLPATNLKLRDRGSLQAGYYADVVVFDPATVQDRATFAVPHALATGVEHVWINGGQVLKDGVHTGATPGRVVRGPGWTGWKKEGATLAAAE